MVFESEYCADRYQLDKLIRDLPLVQDNNQTTDSLDIFPFLLLINNNDKSRLSDNSKYQLGVTHRKIPSKFLVIISPLSNKFES